VTSALVPVSKSTQPSPAIHPLPLTGSQVRVQTRKVVVPSMGIAQRPPEQSVSVRQRLRQTCEPPIVAQKALRPQSPSITQGKPIGVVPTEVVQVGAPVREIVQRWPVAQPVWRTGSQGAAAQVPTVPHSMPVGQLPQVPPQPSGPQVRPVQLRTHATQAPDDVLHICPVGHVPQVPPQPSEPQVRPVQSRVHEQVPAVLHVCPVGQVPQAPPQPLGPQVRPAQVGVHEQLPTALQVCPVGQVPQVPPQPSGPQGRPAQVGVHAPQSWSVVVPTRTVWQL